MHATAHSVESNEYLVISLGIIYCPPHLVIDSALFSLCLWLDTYTICVAKSCVKSSRVPWEFPSPTIYFHLHERLHRVVILSSLGVVSAHCCKWNTYLRFGTSVYEESCWVQTRFQCTVYTDPAVSDGGSLFCMWPVFCLFRFSLCTDEGVSYNLILILTMLCICLYVLQ